REDRSQRRVVITRQNRPPATGRFARRPGPERRTAAADGSKGPGPGAAPGRPGGWRGRLPGRLQRPLAWHAPVAGRAVVGAGRAAASAGRTVRDRLRLVTQRLPQTAAGRLLAAVIAIAFFAGATWTTTR